MFKAIFRLIKTCIVFWKGLIASNNKGVYWSEHKEYGLKQNIKLLGLIIGLSIVIPAGCHLIKGSFVDMCRFVVQKNSSTNFMLQDNAVPVEAKKLATTRTVREISSIGSLKANRDVVIKSEITGKITEILFEEGSVVNEGDVLIKFEDTALQAEVDRWAAEYALRKEETERNRTLYQQKAGAQKSYKESEAQMKIALAQLDNARYQLTKATIKAPFSGKIGILKGAMHPGNIVQQQTELVSIVDNSKMNVEFMIPARYFTNVGVGQSLTVSSESSPDKKFSGIVVGINPEIDTKSHSLLVKGVISNDQGLLMHGMLVNVKILTGEKDGVIVVDDESLDREGQHEFVWVIDKKGHAYRRKVITGAKNENGVEIVAGLAAGETVVISGQLRLTDGVKVKILNENDFKGDETLKTPTDVAKSVIDEARKAG